MYINSSTYSTVIGLGSNMVASNELKIATELVDAITDYCTRLLLAGSVNNQIYVARRP